MLETQRSGRFAVKVWGAITEEGTLVLHIFDGNMDGHLYVDILTDVLFPAFEERFPGESIYLQQVNIIY
jgi:hypothetical protein